MSDSIWVCNLCHSAFKFAALDTNGTTMCPHCHTTNITHLCEDED